MGIGIEKYKEDKIKTAIISIFDKYLGEEYIFFINSRKEKSKRACLWFWRSKAYMSVYNTGWSLSGDRECLQETSRNHVAYPVKKIP